MGQLCTFRSSSCPRCIKNARIAIGIKSRSWLIAAKRFQRSIIYHILTEVFQANPNNTHIRKPLPNIHKAVMALLIAYQNFRLGVFQGESKLFFYPPSIDTNNCNANINSPPISESPFWKVSHGYGNAITRLNTIRQQPITYRCHLCVSIFIEPSFIPIDDVIFLSMRFGHPPYIPQSRWSKCERSNFYAVNLSCRNSE